VSTHGRRRQGPPPARQSPDGLSPSRLSPGLPSLGRPGSPGAAQLGWALLVIVAALVGGLAAAALVHATITIAVIVSVAVGGVAILAMLRSPTRPPDLPPGSRSPQGAYAAQDPHAARSLDPYASRDPNASQAPRTVPLSQASRAVPPASFAPPAPDPAVPGPAGGPPGPHETVVQLLPLPPQPGQPGPDAPWWDSPQGAPPPSAGSKRAPAPDLSTYLASTFIAQCPRCGAFRLDIRRARKGWDFRCEACEHTWTWQPGTPWPPVRVMPRGRRE
jgi:hypothetical protein